MHVADVLAHEMTSPANDGTGQRTTLDGAYLESAGVVARLPGWRAMAAALTGEM